MSPRAWSAKDERQYEHVKQSELERGRKRERAEEIAARTVNKQRRSEGRAEQPRSRATGNPNASLHERSRDELYNRARELAIDGHSKMRKSDLIRAIRERS